MISDQLHPVHVPEPPAAQTLYRPFDTLPPELSSQIMTSAWLSYSGDDSLDRFNFPSTLCKINHYFNRIALSTPILWSYLRVTYVTELAHIQKRIKRSGALLLDLYLLFDTLAYEDAMSLVRGTIMQSPSRFRTIMLSYARMSIIQIPDGRHFWDHLDPLNTAPVQAVRFSIDAENAPPLELLPPLPSSIRRLDLAYNRFGWSQDSLPGSLEVLSIRESWGDEVSVATIVGHLTGSLAHSLRSLSLSHTLVKDEDGVLTNPCTLESLAYFKLDEYYLWEVIVLCSCILTPNLQHLHLNVPYDDNLSDARTAAWNALRFPNLRKLTLQSFHGETVRLLELVQNLPPSLQSLECIGDGPLAALKDPLATAFCGQLHQITTRGLSLGAIVPLIVGRCSSLRVLEVRNQRIVARTWEEYVRCFDALASSVGQLRILDDGRGRESYRPTGLTLEELAAPFKTEQNPDDSTEDGLVGFSHFLEVVN